MPRNMSFALTTPQMRARTKTVTRRMRWANLQPGEVLNAVEQGMGLRKGERVRRIGHIRVLSTRWEPISVITAEDVAREGFPGWTPAQFISFFCKHNRCAEETLVNRIEFEHMEASDVSMLARH